MTSQEIATFLRRDYDARYGTPRDEFVEEGRVRDFLLAMDEPADLFADGLVPSLFVLTLGRDRCPQPSEGIAVNAVNDHEFLLPLRVGDRITVRRSVTGVEEKQGKPH